MYFLSCSFSAKHAVRAIWIVFAVIWFQQTSSASDEAVSRSSNLGNATDAPNKALAPDALENAGAKIGEITVVTDNIFDGDNPEERRKLHRWANSLHVVTRPDVVRTQLLFHAGESYSKQQVEETERLLRSNRYLREAEVTATTVKDGVVDLEVRTSDVWTLNPSISFGRGGGENRGGIGLKEFNLLGSGVSIGLGYKTNIDRDTLSLKYSDRNIFSSRFALDMAYTDASDGYTQRFGVEKPFFALDTERAGGLLFEEGRQTESLYDSGEIAAQFEHTFVNNEAYLGLSSGLNNNWSRRYLVGAGYDSHEFSILDDGLHPQAELTPDRKFVYPFVGFELLQDAYVTTRDFDQMNRTEDRHLGLRASMKLGYASRQFGSTNSAWILKGQLSNTLLRDQRSTLVFNAGLDGRMERGSLMNARLSIASRYDLRQSEKRLLHVSLEATAGKNLDLDNTTYIGGDNGLRGYPLRYQAGDSSVLLTIEQRMFTEWYPWRLFNIGGAVFFDAGRTWGNDPINGKRHGWLRNVGLGLRIGSTRSGIGRMIHVDLAYPLDGGTDISKAQLLIEARKGF